MPELPEVETVRRGLAPVLVGRRLVRVEARRSDLRFPLPERFCERLSGALVLGLDRRAKYLRAALDTGETLICHLGMSGRFTVEDQDRALAQPGRFHHAVALTPAHEHVVLETDAGARIGYVDPRRFGYMDLAAREGLEVHPFFAGLGPEPLGPDFDGATLAKACAGRSQSIKATLLDQRIVAGLGNIYVCEALHRCGIAPTRAAGQIARARLARLVAAIKAVLMEAIEAGGSSLRDYARTDGELGYFQHAFRVYDREDAPCLTARCGGTVRRIVQNGRSTFHCPACQR